MSIVLVEEVVAGSRDFSKYDGYLGNQGLVYHHTAESRPTTQTLPLRPTRQDTGQNSWQTRPESGDVFSQGEFFGGMGQAYFHTPTSDPDRYLWSDGFKVSDGPLEHTEELTANADLISPRGKPVWLDGTVYTCNSNNVRLYADMTAAGSNETPHAGEVAVTARDLTTDGNTVYAALGVNGIHYRTGVAVWEHLQPDGATDLNVGDARVVRWLRDRLMVVGDAGLSIFEVVNDSTPAALHTLPAGWEFTDIWENGAYIYASAYNLAAQSSIIYRFGLNDAATAMEEKGNDPMPQNVIITRGIGYLGSVWLHGVTLYNSAQAPTFWQGLADGDGGLQMLRIMEGDKRSTVSGSSYIGDIYPDAENILMSWWTSSNHPIANRQGLASYDPARGAFTQDASWAIGGSNVPEIVTGIIRALWRKVVFYRAGLYYTPENATPLPLVASTASFVSSVADWNNAGTKTWDQIEINHKPLPAGASVAVYYTTQHPDDNAWTLAGTSNTADSTGDIFTLTNVTSRLFALKLVSTRGSNTTSAPEILGYSVRSNPKPETTEWVLTRTVRILSKDQKDGGGAEFRQNPKTVRDAVLATAYTTTTLYESDATWSVRVEAIRDVKPVLAKGTSTGGNVHDEGYLLELQMLGTKTA